MQIFLPDLNNQAVSKEKKFQAWMLGSGQGIHGILELTLCKPVNEQWYRKLK